MAGFNPWKKAKEQRDATKFAKAFLGAQQAAGEFWNWIEEEGKTAEDVGTGVDEDGRAYGYHPSVHSFYNLAAQHPQLKSTEAQVVMVLNGIVANRKDLSLTKLLNEPIVIVGDTTIGLVVMPKVIRFYNLGNDMYRIGEAVA